jgi:hypothetical protein
MTTCCLSTPGCTCSLHTARPATLLPASTRTHTHSRHSRLRWPLQRYHFCRRSLNSPSAVHVHEQLAAGQNTPGTALLHNLCDPGCVWQVAESAAGSTPFWQGDLQSCSSGACVMLTSCCPPSKWYMPLLLLVRACLCVTRTDRKKT